jgi:hypothetical protein
MQDGAPNGYSVITFDGNQAVVDFKAARRPKDYQLNVIVPEEVSRNSEEEGFVYVNVFGGSEKSKVWMRIGEGGNWVELAKTLEVDPSYSLLKAGEKDRTLLGRPLSDPKNSNHLWKTRLPALSQAGVHRIWVKSEDMYGRVFQASRTIRVR